VSLLNTGKINWGKTKMYILWPPPSSLCASLPVQLLQLWEKNGYFDDVTIQQLQNPALGLGQYQVRALGPEQQLIGGRFSSLELIGCRFSRAVADWL